MAVDNYKGRKSWWHKEGQTCSPDACQWWSCLGSFWRLELGGIESLSKTTKLLLLDSLLQEVCIKSGSDGSLALSSLGLSVCLVSSNLLYSGLKKAQSKMKSSKKNSFFCLPHWMMPPCLVSRFSHIRLSFSQSIKYYKCYIQSVSQ